MIVSTTALLKLDTEEMIDEIKNFCGSILNRPEYQELRQMINVFTKDEQSIGQYEHFMEAQQALQSLQQQDVELSQAEMTAYEEEERALYENDVIRKFLYAEHEFNKLHHLVMQYFVKTIELNRLPEPTELEKSGGSCGCGGNCGCGAGHH